MSQTLSTERITILKTEYDQLLERDRILTALEAAGVDNWEGYSEALRDKPDETYEDIYGKGN